jgi:hypothetical protein
MTKTAAEFFILESLDWDDEEHYREGKILSRTLRMSGKSPIYRYFRTRKELKRLLHEFANSGYRYLHISCHGAPQGIHTTMDFISTDELCDMFGSILDRRRLFLSTCDATTRDLASRVFATSACYSVCGPAREINFDDAVILWTTLYHLLFKEDPDKINRERLRRFLGNCATLLDVQLRAYVRTGTGKAQLLRL